MQKRMVCTGFACAFAVLLLCIISMGIAAWIPQSISVFQDEGLPEYPCVSLDEISVQNEDGISVAAVKLFGVIPLKEVKVQRYDRLSLIPGGMVFGVKIPVGGVTVAGMSEVKSNGTQQSPAKEAGMAVGDVIVKIDGIAVTAATDVTRAIETGAGSPVRFTCRRGEQEMTFTVTPCRSDDDLRYKTGIWVRDSSSGIGTITFIDPTTGAFGGLGHGICDADTGELLSFDRGTVTEVHISGVTPGKPGSPGEIRGVLQKDKWGTVLNNTECGVFGVLQHLPEELPAAVPVALCSEVKTGDATIYCTLQDGKREAYTVRITGINRNGSTKCFTLKITDPRLLDASGGIVQGMSGSPILQDGKLIGAVTHVLINDPTGGYGISVENMLKSMPMAITPVE